MPQALDELVHPIEAEAVLGRVADVHRHVLRVELVLRGEKSVPMYGKTRACTHPEVSAAGQAGETDDLVVRLAEPGDLPAAQVVDGRERIRRRDTERDGDTTVSGAGGRG